MSNALIDWLEENLYESPHEIDDPELKNEFDELFGHHVILWPQPGGQTDFQKCEADIVFYGGEAGAGKSWSILYDHLKWIHLPNYIGVVGRKEYSQIFDAGGLWDEAERLYKLFGGKPSRGDKPKFIFPSGAQVYFKHSQHASKIDKYWQGLQSAVIDLDEVTQFSKEEFLYISSRNRSMSGVRSYIRATCNPDPNSWVRKMIDWWIDDKGYIIEDRCGIIRYYVHRFDDFVWADSPEELIEKFGPKTKPKSFTFIRGKLKDNKKLLELDPDYEASLQNLTEAQRQSLAEGNWNVVENPDAIFKQKWINKYRIDDHNFDISFLKRIVIGIDPAGSTNNDSDLTGIVAAGIGRDGHAYVLEDATGKYKPYEWAKEAIRLYDKWEADLIVAEKNFGGDMVESTIRTERSSLYPKLVHASRGKDVRAEPVSLLYKNACVHHVGHNLFDLEAEMCSFVPGKSKSPNRMDALVWTITELIPTHQKKVPRIRQLGQNK